MKKINRITTVFCTLFVLLSCVFLGAQNVQNFVVPLSGFFAEGASFADYVERVKENYTENFSSKNKFIDLNGLFVRAVGRRMSNKTILLPDGMLVYASWQVDMSLKAEKTIQFSDYLKENDIEFLYVQMPTKMDVNNKLLDGHAPDDFQSFSNANANEMLHFLKENNVNILDLRPFVSETPEMVEQYFIKTDHHWNYTGAFVGMQKVESRIREMTHGRVTTHTDIENWEKHQFDNWQLGSYGKRVGKYFAGLDPLIYYTPLFDTKISVAIPSRCSFQSGNFEQAVVQEHYLTEPNIYTDFCNYIYTGDDYGLVQYRNIDAPNDLRMLIIKDSFGVPVSSFLSTIYSEIDVYDPRYFTECSIAEYVSRFDPDIVIMMASPDIFSDESYFKFGTEETSGFVKTVWRPLMRQDAIEISAEDNQYASSSLPIKLIPGKRYKLSFQDVEFVAGTSDGIALSLFDTINNHEIRYSFFDIQFNRLKGDFEWVFDVPDDSSYEVRLYAGIPGKTQQVDIKYIEVELSTVALH